MSSTLSIRLPSELNAWLEEEARRRGLPKGRIVREQLERVRRETKEEMPWMKFVGCVEGEPDLSEKRGYEP